VRCVGSPVYYYDPRSLGRTPFSIAATDYVNLTVPLDSSYASQRDHSAVSDLLMLGHVTFSGWYNGF
jgi:hypothetical protein